jgi:hypothetical protein
LSFPAISLQKLIDDCRSAKPLGSCYVIQAILEISRDVEIDELMGHIIPF